MDASWSQSDKIFDLRVAFRQLMTCILAVTALLIIVTVSTQIAP